MSKTVLIIGSGPAGLTAAIYISRGGYQAELVGGYMPGSQLALTTEVENFPGFPDGIQGPELIDNMRRQAVRFGTKIDDEDAAAVDFKSRPFKAMTADHLHSGDAVIIATGASSKWLGLESEARLKGKGVSSCATCDGFFFREKDVVVVGGGDTAMEETLFMARLARQVTVIHRHEKLSASHVLRQRAMNSPKVHFVWNNTVEEILGKENVEGVIVRDMNTGRKSQIECQGVFIAIGHKPNTEIFKGHLDMDSLGYVITKPNRLATSVEGVFVAGDVYDYYYR